jgi:23S rRNA pseudoU1915 N3-methylase RlmH
MDLRNMKNNYKKIYDNSSKTCIEENIEIQDINANINRNTKKRRLNENNETLEEHHTTQFNKIIDIHGKHGSALP